MARWCGYRIHFGPHGEQIDYSDSVNHHNQWMSRDFLLIGNEESNLKEDREPSENANPEEEIIWMGHTAFISAAWRSSQGVQWRSWGGLKNLCWSFHSPILAMMPSSILINCMIKRRNSLRRCRWRQGKRGSWEVFGHQSKFVFEFLEFYTEH